LGLDKYSTLNPYEDVRDWEAGTSDFSVRIKPDGQRVNIYNNAASCILYPTPILSPVFSSIYNYGSEFPMAGEREQASKEEAQAKEPHGYFTVTMAEQVDTAVYYANGPGYRWNIPAPMPLVVARRHGSWSTFMAALDAYRRSGYVLSARSLLSSPEAAAMQVTTSDSQETFIANYGNSPVEAEGIYLEGELAVVSVQAGTVNWALLVNGSRLRLGDFVIEAKQPKTFVAELNASGQWQTWTATGKVVSVSVQPGVVEE